MFKAMHKIKNSLVHASFSVKILAIALLASAGFILPAVGSTSLADNCPNPPTQAVLNWWPVSFTNPAQPCHDFTALSAKLVGGAYPTSQAELDAGLNAPVGSEIIVRIYAHNGAIINGGPETIARNFRVSTTVDTSTGANHTVGLTMAADNTNTVSRTITIHTDPNAQLQVVPGSGELYDHTAALQRSGFDLGNTTYNYGDFFPCFERSMFFLFHIRVINSAPTSTVLGITKNVRNVTQNQTGFVKFTAASTGDTVEYQVRIRNNGQAVARNVTFSDSGTSGTTLTGTAPSPNLGDLAVGQESVVSYQARVSGGTGSYTNTTSARADNAPQVSDTAQVTVNPILNLNTTLSITKNVRDVTQNQANFVKTTSANSGDIVEYKVVVTNTGANTARNVIITDPLTPGLNPNGNASISVSFTGTLPSGLHVGDLGPGNSITLTYQAQVTASAPATLTNTASARADNAPQVSDSASVTVATPGNPVLRITKQVRNASRSEINFQHSTNVTSGETVEYQVVVSNSGNATARSVIITDPLTAGLNPTGSASVSTGFTGTLPNGINVGDLSAGQSVTIRYQAQITTPCPNSTITLTNTATARADNAPQVNDNAQVTVAACQPTNTQLRIVKQVRTLNGSFQHSVNVTSGDTVEYQAVVTNIGNNTAHSVIVTDPLANGLNPNGSSSVSTNFSGNLVSGINVGDLSAGQSVTIRYQAQVTTPCSNSTIILTNTARARASNAPEVSDNAQVLINSCIVNNPQLRITKDVRNVSQGQSNFSDSTDARQNETVEYQAVVQNVGIGTARNVTISDFGVNGLNFSNSPSVSRAFNGSLSGSGINVSDLNAGDSVTIRYQAQVTVSGPTTLVNTATARADNASQVQDTARVNVNQVIVVGNAQLNIIKLVRNTNSSSSFQNSVNANNNDRVTFQITVSNIGSQTANNVRVSDVLPSGLNIDTGSVRLDSTSISASPSLFATFSLFPGQQRVITFDAIVNTGNLSANNNCMLNTAQAQADNAGLVQSSASVCVTVLGSNINLAFSKKAFNETKNADATTVTASREDFITYTLTVTNSGNAPANDFVITDDLSGVLPLADMVDANGGTVNNNVITYPAVTVPAGGSVSKTFRVRVKFFLSNNLSYQMRNTYGNTVVINIGSVQGATFVAPKTGANTTSALAFAGFLTAGFVAWKKRSMLVRLIWA